MQIKKAQPNRQLSEDMEAPGYTGVLHPRVSRIHVVLKRGVIVHVVYW